MRLHLGAKIVKIGDFKFENLALQNRRVQGSGDLVHIPADAPKLHLDRDQRDGVRRESVVRTHVLQPAYLVLTQPPFSTQDNLTALQLAAKIKDAAACEEIIDVLFAAGAEVDGENRDDELVNRNFPNIGQL